jgi:hypothetical protein
MLPLEHIFELHKQGLTTGKIALAIGLPRNPASRQRIRTILKGPEPRKPSHLKPEAPQKFIHQYSVDTSVRRSTGHKFQPKRNQEAEFILQQFARYECKFKDDVQEWLDGLDLVRITPDELFRLRDMYARKRKIFG